MHIHGMRLKKPLSTSANHAIYTWSPVEAECEVDNRVFAGISESHIPILRKEDRRWRTPTF